jgi:CMP-N-acetylneuraminic acid synthetase
MNHKPSDTKQTDPSNCVIALIFARGGSKGVPGKNKRILGEIPLLAYTVSIASKVKNIDRVVVSTEDSEIASIAKKYGGEVPFLRPQYLSQDNSNLDDAMSYTRNRLEMEWNLPMQYITVTMFPTSPFRNVQEMEFLVDKAKSGFQVSTVTGINHSQHSVFFSDQKNCLNPLLPGQQEKHRFFRFNGYCLIANWGSEPMPNFVYEVKNPISLIDIDHWEDFYLAESVIEQKLYDFGMDFQS